MRFWRVNLLADRVARSATVTKLAGGASEVWRGVWDDFRNWIVRAL